MRCALLCALPCASIVSTMYGVNGNVAPRKTVQNCSTTVDDATKSLLNYRDAGALCKQNTDTNK